VTILFCDAAASTSVGERIDAESLRAVMTRYFDAMRAVVERHGGVVEKFIGDAMMAVFGVPRVHEDDALRAVRASLEIRERLLVLDEGLRSERGVSIEWRTGLNTGEVVAGDTAEGHRFVTGDAVNVAARLEQAAQPGEILLGDPTYRLVHDAVQVEAATALALKGKSTPVRAYRLIGEAGTEPRPARLQSPVIGRDRPRRLLDEAWQQVISERICHLFTILGAAGVGKSRIINDFVERHMTGARAVYGRCLAYGEGITYWPLGEVVRTLAGITDEDDSATARSRIEATLKDEADAATIAERLSAAIGLGEARGTPEETAWAARRFLEVLAAGQPLVVVIDDLQWAEPAMLDMVDHIATWTLDAPILLIGLAREELLDIRPAWGGGKRSATTITLEPLNESESAELVGNLIGGAELPEALRDRIVAASEGNPLFVEELLGMLMDEGDLVAENGHWKPVRDLTMLSVPPTIHALLAARLDGLPSQERAVLERGAVEGKVFHRGAVSELVPEAERPALPVQLLALTRKELLRPDRSEFAGEEAYRFRHLLIRDAAYQAMPKATRADLHERFADWLGRVVGDRMVEYEEIIAYHLEQAYQYRTELGPPDAAAEALAAAAAARLANAGTRAHRRRDMHAAANLLRRAVRLMGNEDADRPRVLARLGDALWEAAEYTEADRVLSDALDVARSRHDELWAARAELSLLELRSSSEHLENSEIEPRLKWLTQELGRLGDVEGHRDAVEFGAFHLFALGHAQQASELLEAITAEAGDLTSSRGLFSSVLYWGPTPVEEGIARIQAILDEAGPDPVVEHLLYRGLGALYGLMGSFDRGRELLERSRSLGLELGMRFRAEGVKGHFLGPLERLAGNLERAAQLEREAFESMTAAGDQAFASTAAGALAICLTEMGHFDEAEVYAQIATDTASSDDFVSQAMSRAVMGRILATRGEIEEGEAYAREAVRLVDASDYLTYRGEMQLELASVLTAAGRRDDAEEAVRRAIAHFEAKGATAWITRARKWLPTASA
jgi:class 3 adenylate cyclase/tetratricopeptide (TPR) repeat protein